jgi:hypothetical protein
MYVQSNVDFQITKMSNDRMLNGILSDNKGRSTFWHSEIYNLTKTLYDQKYAHNFGKISLFCQTLMIYFVTKF